VRTRREAIRFHIWTYAHFPLALGIIVAGVGIHRSVTAASRAVVGPTDVLMLGGAVTLVMLALTAIAAMSAGRQRHTSGSMAGNLTIAARDAGDYARRPHRVPVLSI
jgi:low temperature requirement protein LtrA